MSGSVGAKTECWRSAGAGEGSIACSVCSARCSGVLGASPDGCVSVPGRPPDAAPAAGARLVAWRHAGRRGAAPAVTTTTPAGRSSGRGPRGPRRGRPRRRAARRSGRRGRARRGLRHRPGRDRARPAGLPVVGVDNDPSMLATARAKAPELEWVEADLDGLDTDSATGGFDAVVAAGNVMIFLAHGSEARVVASLARHLEPGGLLIAGFQLGTPRGRGPAGPRPLRRGRRCRRADPGFPLVDLGRRAVRRRRGLRRFGPPRGNDHPRRRRRPEPHPYRDPRAAIRSSTRPAPWPIPRLDAPSPPARPALPTLGVLPALARDPAGAPPPSGSSSLPPAAECRRAPAAPGHLRRPPVMGTADVSVCRW